MDVLCCTLYCGLIKSKGVRSVAQKMRELTLNTQLVFDYLKMTRNSCWASAI